MRIGKATSTDGLNWTKCSSSNPLLCEGSEGEFDAVFVGWPSLLPATVTADTTTSSSSDSSSRVMLYHTLCFNPFYFMIGRAVSSDSGETWQKCGRIELKPFGDDSNFRGHGGRYVRTSICANYNKFVLSTVTMLMYSSLLEI
jgi:hypothetical protein